MCPPPPAPVRLSRLPVNVTLNAIPWNPVDLDGLPEKKCRINGFETKNGIRFLSLRINVKCTVCILQFLRKLGKEIVVATILLERAMKSTSKG